MDKVKSENDKAEFFRLYAKYVKKIPTDYLNKVIVAHPDWSADRIINVKYGKTHDLEILKEILKLNKIIR